MRRGRLRRSDVLPRSDLVGTHVRLRLLRAGDADELAAFYVRNRAHLAPFEPHREEGFFTLGYQEQVLAQTLDAMAEGRGAYWGIFADGRLAGRISLMNIVRYAFQSAFLAYAVDEAEQGRGYATEAVALAIDYGFRELGLHRVEASTLVDNHRSQSVLLANGFVKLGLNRKYLEIQGAWRDHYTFYRLADDEPPAAGG